MIPLGILASSTRIALPDALLAPTNLVATLVEPPPASDPYWDNVVSLLHFDGDYIDETGKTWTGIGNAQLTDDSFFGSGALYTPPTNQSALISTHSDLIMGTDDFTVELFVNTPSGNSTAVVSVSGCLFYFSESYYMLYHASASNFLIATSTPPFNTYHHVVFQRASGVFSVYASGMKIGEVNTALNLTEPDVKIGFFNSANPGRCKVDELRITKGVARYTEDFTPPTEPFPDFGPNPFTPD